MRYLEVYWEVLWNVACNSGERTKTLVWRFSMLRKQSGADWRLKASFLKTNRWQEKTSCINVVIFEATVLKSIGGSNIHQGWERRVTITERHCDFGTWVNGKGCILDSSCRKISKELNMAWIPTARKELSQRWYLGYQKKTKIQILWKLRSCCSTFYSPTNVPLKPATIQLFN